MGSIAYLTVETLYTLRCTEKYTCIFEDDIIDIMNSKEMLAKIGLAFGYNCVTLVVPSFDYFFCSHLVYCKFSNSDEAAIAVKHENDMTNAPSSSCMKFVIHRSDDCLDESLYDEVWNKMMSMSQLQGFMGYAIEKSSGILVAVEDSNTPLQVVWDKHESYEMFLLKIDMLVGVHQ